ncbi:MAG: hemerythrin domain-containing protein [Gammaproteobacteria bacterium]|nr:hemerythrin domain-containing protein [Gammaproteobacteria bacterium]MBU1625230.1 hemerythrin domain-containing protein [Gammaproteobacteria bacterium]MBU1981490.1 hemerythrin domain-containing protein [Gammaproteobacteria bacterium]
MPWRLEWSPELSVHIPEIDAEHKHFIELINALNEAIAERMSLSEVRKRMQDVIDDAVAHFGHEEVLFIEWGYPEAEQHAREHAAAANIFTEIMKRIEKSEQDYDWVEAGLQVKQLLVSHLLNEDMKYRDFWLAQQNGKENVNPD